MPPVTIDLVLIGFGHVARRFVRLLEERAAVLARDHGFATRVIGIATARHGCLVQTDGLDAAGAARHVERGGQLGALPSAGGIVLPHGPLDTIARCAGDGDNRPVVMIETTTLDIERGEPATTHIRRAFDAGMHVVTANKGPIACAWRLLRDDALRRGCHFFFEGTVLDGIPVFNLVRETLPAVRVLGFRGVLNTTTSYALEEMEAGRELADAVAEMQRAGIAEADASLDLEGWDAAAKTAALVNVLMGGDLTPRAVDRTGIIHLTGSEVREARRAGRRLKLVASASRQSGPIEARVAPAALDEDDPLARLSGLDNAIVLQTDLAGEIVVIERAGGLLQTAYALLTDLVAVARHLRVQAPRPRRRSG
jgi:homoserine dehydrogenase